MCEQLIGKVLKGSEPGGDGEGTPLSLHPLSPGPKETDIRYLELKRPRKSKAKVYLQCCCYLTVTDNISMDLDSTCINRHEKPSLCGPTGTPVYLGDQYTAYPLTSLDSHTKWRQINPILGANLITPHCGECTLPLLANVWHHLVFIWARDNQR